MLGTDELVMPEIECKRTDFTVDFVNQRCNFGGQSEARTMKPASNIPRLSDITVQNLTIYALKTRSATFSITDLNRFMRVSSPKPGLVVGGCKQSTDRIFSLCGLGIVDCAS